MSDEQFDNGPDSEPREYLVERDGQTYRVDQPTISLLTAAQQFDEGQPLSEHRMQDIAFDHAMKAGRITQGHAYDNEQEQAQTHSHGHRR